jgi:hypothetical protein
MPAQLLRLVSIGTVIAVTACAAPTISSNGAIAAYQASSAAQPATGGSPVIIVSDASQNAVVICPSGSACSQCKTLGGGLSSPNGLTSSNGGGPPAKSPLGYVADSGNHRVVVFTDACTTVRILDDGQYTPIDVAVASDGTVAVTNLCESSYCSGSPNIAFFAPKSTKITRLAKGLMTEYLYGAFDKKGDFYNDGYSGSTVEVGVVARNSTTDEATGITGIASPGGLEVAKNGTVNILDAACPCIRIYKGSANAGTVKFTGVTTPVTFAFDKKNKRIWLTDAASETVDELRYPGGGKILYRYEGFSEPIGVAIIPPAAP